MPKGLNKGYRWRSAISGRFIPGWLARLIPWLTVRERR
jgi:hypothetical protein